MVKSLILIINYPQSAKFNENNCCYTPKCITEQGVVV